jgi:D-glycero-alpha-D-manno-heptose 1-phosphate guanylyltransferase
MNQQLHPSFPTTAIVLAGGLGTRLKNAVPHLPKCLAPVAGWSFLYYVINHLRMQGIQKIIFSLGYKYEAILSFLEKEFKTLDYDFVIEAEPLGTGGAIALAIQKTENKNVFVVNGDTLFKFNADGLLRQHNVSNAECTLALKPMKNFDRYGVVEMNHNHIITSFKEKQKYKSGLINAGVYLINKDKFLQRTLAQKFSFEKDYLEKFVCEKEFAGVQQDDYFIDIGIPEDLHRAQNELMLSPFDLKKIDKTWTLFLDRDGVINHDKAGSYIFNEDEFEFMNGVPDLFKKLTDIFNRIIIITNQRGVGKGLMSLQNLEKIHQKMLRGIEKAGGKIDAIYFATGTNNKDFMRKPNPGMALAAKKDFPEIDFSKSIMVGNNITDMEFARNAGMKTVFLSTTMKLELPNVYVDLAFKNLKDFAEKLNR